MAGAKVIVLYPTPPDVDAFERTYTADHVPMVTAQNFPGIQKFVASKVVGTGDAVQEAAGSASAQKVVAHAVSISSGGKPVFLVSEEETKTF